MVTTSGATAVAATLTGIRRRRRRRRLTVMQRLTVMKDKCARMRTMLLARRCHLRRRPSTTRPQMHMEVMEVTTTGRICRIITCTRRRRTHTMHRCLDSSRVCLGQ